jgi:hypothetical protein
MRALALCFLLACGGSAPPPATTPPPAAEPAPTAATPATPPPAGSGAQPDLDAIIVKMGSFKDKLCACPDSACMEGVSDEMATWGKDLEAKGMMKPQPTDDQAKRVTAITDEMAKCYKRISNMGG